ncbi:MAG TPA: hypothetical protein VKQ34_00025 [Candidatus Saccharimonadales bacterium]|nr:hypothetical protein [Candidatus Saccharimonadales bacterium]
MIRKIGFISLFVLGAAVLGGGAYYYIFHSSVTSASVCEGTHGAHTVLIQHNVMTPVHTSAHHCDKLTITNMDATDRLVAFGPHEHHVAYDGVTDQLLLQGQSLTITLNQIGTFNFHDHLHDEVAGDFTVAP